MCNCVSVNVVPIRGTHPEGTNSLMIAHLMSRFRIVLVLVFLIGTACGGTENLDPDETHETASPPVSRESETYVLHHVVSKTKTINYKRVITFDPITDLYRVRDHYENGQLQMDGTYSAFDKRVKENLWCNYRTNVKEGVFREWYEDGTLESHAHFSNGLRHGLYEYWYPSGQRESTQDYDNGRKHGKCIWWNEDGSVQHERLFKNGLNQDPKNVEYQYISYTPNDYDLDSTERWPLIIYLHGGTPRGTDLNRLYAYGIPDQIYRGREFPFIIIAPQCPLNHRWSTDLWFEKFFEEVTTKFRVDLNRVYLTGVSLGGSGTWFLAAKHPDKFAAIAPIAGFTGHMDFIGENLERLEGMPIWAFHGKADLVVEYEDSEKIVNRLKGMKNRIRFTAEPNVGHEIHWSVYPGNELYDWFLTHDRSQTRE
jgi:hypothetical protein